jgi:hypothetical protein
MESVIKDQLVQFLADKGIITKRQRAVIEHHSTASNYGRALLIALRPLCLTVIFSYFFLFMVARYL